MCGLVGFLGGNQPWSGGEGAARTLVGELSKQISSRGPDDSGEWLDIEHRIAFGFSRLSVLDLSPNGHQPMASGDGRWVMVYNGEIYNHASLRIEAEKFGHTNWRGHSDTEVILALVEKLGVVAALEKLEGMFAIALWDRSENALWLARDRLGEKPLYYGNGKDGSFLFASELKALRPHPEFDSTLDRGAIAVFLRHGFISDPLSIYLNIKKLEPGHYLKVSNGNIDRPQTYWDASARFINARKNELKTDRAGAVKLLSDKIDSSVALRMVADVPVGAFLSGGIDSSTIVSSMVLSGKGLVKTFSIGFDGSRFDESPHAIAVAKHLGTDHTTFHLTEKDCIDLVPQMPAIYDEPFADASQIPTALLCRVTRKHVTVAMSGDGGDELFGGYGRYLGASNRWNAVQNQPGIIGSFARGFCDFARGSNVGMIRRVRKKMRARSYQTPDETFRDQLSWWRPDDGIYNESDIGPSGWEYPLPGNNSSLARAFMWRDGMVYLPSDLLVKVDRASMASSLEVRAPLLDYNLVEFIWSLPDELTVNDGAKGILRDVLYQRVPPKLIDRPKQGFEPPMGQWLRGPLRVWAYDMLSPSRISRHGLYNPAPVLARLDEHMNSRRNWTYQLWTVLSLEQWLAENGI